MSESPIESDGEYDRVVKNKKQRFLDDSKESVLEERVSKIVNSIDKMAAEAREDRQELTNVLKNLIDELQRRL